MASDHSRQSASVETVPGNASRRLRLPTALGLGLHLLAGFASLGPYRPGLSPRLLPILQLGGPPRRLESLRVGVGGEFPLELGAIGAPPHPVVVKTHEPTIGLRDREEVPAIGAQVIAQAALGHFGGAIDGFETGAWKVEMNVIDDVADRDALGGDL